MAATATAIEAKPKASTTTLKATLNADGTLDYAVPKRDEDRFEFVLKQCRAYAAFPALKEKAEDAERTLAVLMAELGMAT